MTAHAPTARPWYREPLVVMVVAIPGLTVIGCMVTLWLAIRSDDGVVVDDYYKRGLAINRQLERDEAARRHGIAPSLAIARERGEIALTLTAGPGFRQPATIRLSLLRAGRAGEDRIVTLAQAGDGRYHGTTAPLAMGRWYTLLEADDWRNLDEVYLR